MHFKNSYRQGGGGVVQFSYEFILGGTVFIHHTFLKTLEGKIIRVSFEEFKGKDTLSVSECLRHVLCEIFES